MYNTYDQQGCSNRNCKACFHTRQQRSETRGQPHCEIKAIGLVEVPYGFGIIHQAQDSRNDNGRQRKQGQVRKHGRQTSQGQSHQCRCHEARRTRLGIGKTMPPRGRLKRRLRSCWPCPSQSVRPMHQSRTGASAPVVWLHVKSNGTQHNATQHNAAQNKTKQINRTHGL